MSNRAVFLDRDGTLIEHYDYLTDASQVSLLPRTASALRLLKEHGYLLVLVTNQSAVARGMLTEETLYEIHDKLKEQLSEKGVYLDQIYCCPFHPEGVVEKYRRESDLRKPSPGMLKLAADELDIDLSQSWMVGDDDRDVQAGERAGCTTIQIDSHTTSSFVHRGETKPDYRAVNLQEAANLIVRFSDRREHRELRAHRFFEPESESKETKQQSESGREAYELPRQPPEESQAHVVRVSDEPAKREPLPAHRFAKTSGFETKESASLSGKEPSFPATVSGADSVSIQGSHDPERKSISDVAEPEERDEIAKAVRDMEIARRKDQKKQIEKKIKLRDPLEIETTGSREHDSEDTRHLLAQILRELKTSNRQKDFTEFSISKLLAGVTQMLVVLCLILSLWFSVGVNPRPSAAHSCLLVALTLQVLTLTLLTVSK